MKVLLIGSGGREAAMAYALKGSNHLTALYASPGSDGLGEIANIIPKMDDAALLDFAQREAIDLVIFGGEAELVAGQADVLRAAGIAVLGASRAAAQLEGSKDYLKDVLFAADVPCAASQSFDDLGQALEYLATRAMPIVLKTDGLAGGKGVVICETLVEARDWAAKYLSGEAFGAAGELLVIEDFLEGSEISFFVLVDQEGGAHPLAAARDHKRIFDGDQGANTGGMGAFTPVAEFTPALQAQVIDEIIRPSLKEMEKRGAPFAGFLFAGLMLTKDGPRLLEYNVRLGDPETQVILQNLPVDFLTLCKEAATGALHEDAANALQNSQPKGCLINVVLAAKGYPEAPEKGAVIAGLDGFKAGEDYFHAGTKFDQEWHANGGRVLNILGQGANIDAARDDAYAKINAIQFDGMQFRRDIGKTRG